MKKLVIIALLSTFSMAEAASIQKGKSLQICKSYIEQAGAYEKTMGTDEISKKTLAFYKEKMFVHCGSISAKTKFEKKSFIAMMAKNVRTTISECKMAIDMAGKYSENEKQLEIIVVAHKENIVDNCGTLVASHVSSFCLYDENK
jgi:uncharacterized protein YunC (DUF1805 family)